MVSIISPKQKVFCDIRRFIFRSWTNKLWFSIGIYPRATPLPNIYHLSQALNRTGSDLYADNNCIFYQNKDVEKIEKALNKELSSFCEWFLDNKLFHFQDDITKSFFSLSQEKPTKTKHIIKKSLSKTAQYCRISWMLLDSKTKFQIAQIKCINFCLVLSPCSYVSSSHVRKINWFLIESRIQLCTFS